MRWRTLCLTLVVWAAAPCPLFAQTDAGIDESPVDVTVMATGPSAEQKRRSAEAITVVDLSRAETQSADLGEVLARTEGVAIRRSGGLGSEAQISLNGLWGQQIRTFIDGVPSGLLFPFDIASVPLSLVRQVEIFRGVVPIRFGADALGGAINLLSKQRQHTGGEASLQTGSFGTARALLSAGYQHHRTGLYVESNAFLDHGKNDYKMDALAPDAQGRPQPVRVKRFHDAYDAQGGSLELGVRDKPWAKRLYVRGYASANHREIQHDLRVTRPEGEDELRARTGGVLGRYELAPSRDVDLDVLALYVKNRIERADPDRYIYDWFGRRISEVRRPTPIDNLFLQRDVYMRLSVSWRLSPQHTLRFSTTPSVTLYDGDTRTLPPDVLDPLAADQRLCHWVSGLEYQSDWWSDRVQNIAFAKSYVYRVDSSQPLAAGMTGTYEQSRTSFGAGDGLRVQVARWLYGKVSYEYATRLPDASEVFGDGLFVLKNLELKPERSHNLNVGPTLHWKRGPMGDLRIELSGYTRLTKDQIVALPVDNISYRNLSDAFAWGVDSAIHWSSIKRYVFVDLTQSYVDSRNRSREGTFSNTYGDRIPNRPWLFASWMLHGRYEYSKHARLEPFYYGRYVHSYYLGWESFGAAGTKREVPTQVTHNVGLSHMLKIQDLDLTATFEVQNLTNATVYDQYRVPRPGRGFYFKLLVAL